MQRDAVTPATTAATSTARREHARWQLGLQQFRHLKHGRADDDGRGDQEREMRGLLVVDAAQQAADDGAPERDMPGSAPGTAEQPISQRVDTGEVGERHDAPSPQTARQPQQDAVDHQEPRRQRPARRTARAECSSGRARITAGSSPPRSAANTRRLSRPPCAARSPARQSAAPTSRARRTPAAPPAVPTCSMTRNGRNRAALLVEATDPSSAGRTTAWPRLLTGNNSVAPWITATRIASIRSMRTPRRARE